MKSSIRKGLMYVTVAVGKIHRERVGSQWQKVNRGIPQWQKVEYSYSIRIVFEGRWDISRFQNPQGVVPLLNQPKLFLKLRVIYVFVVQKSKHP